MRITAADHPRSPRRRRIRQAAFSWLATLSLLACGERAPTDVEIGKALGQALSENGRNPLWEMKDYATHGTKFDAQSRRMVASVDYRIRLKISHSELAALLDANLHSAKPDPAAIDRIETAIAFFTVALGKDWNKGAIYGCRAARLELASSRDGWVLAAEPHFALCPPG